MSAAQLRHILAHLVGLNDVIETPSSRYCGGCMSEADEQVAWMRARLLRIRELIWKMDRLPSLEGEDSEYAHAIDALLVGTGDHDRDLDNINALAARALSGGPQPFRYSDAHHEAYWAERMADPAYAAMTEAHRIDVGARS